MDCDRGLANGLRWRIRARFLPGCEHRPGSWTQSANAICAAAREKAESLGSPEDPELPADVYEQTNRGFRRFIADMRELQVPAESRASHEMVDMYERAMHVQERVPSALRSGDFGAAEKLSVEVNEWGDRGDEIARRLGLEECAKDPGD